MNEPRRERLLRTEGAAAAAARAREPYADDVEHAPLVTPPPEEIELNAVPPAATAVGEGSTFSEERAPLFGQIEANELRSHWDTVQGGFMDEPRKAVEEADALVESAMARLAEIFADERRKLEQHWERGGEVSTEDLRLALRRYRSFFNRLLSV